MNRRLDIVILSDVHLGNDDCHAKALLRYLNSIAVQTLVLNGDFIDLCQFKKSYFPKAHRQVIQRILEMAEQGTKVYYLTGNHDDALRSYADFKMGNVQIQNQLLLQLNKKRYWIFHGDIFDLPIRYSSLLMKLGKRGDKNYLIALNRFVNVLRTRLGRGQMSLAKRIKQKVKTASRCIHDFEEQAIDLAFEKEVDYVICGHLHRPEMRSVERDGKQVTYLNSGDWVEHLTSLEYSWGKWSIYQYDAMDYVSPRLRLASSIRNKGHKLQRK